MPRIAMWCPTDDRFTIRAGALALMRSSSRSVKRNGPRWLTPKVCSNPCAVSSRSVQMPPALLTRTSSRSQRSKISAAARRTDAKSDRSSAMTCTSSFPVRSLISACASPALTRFRQASTVVAPMSARPTAVSLPMPVLEPVITTTLPVMVPSSGLERALEERDGQGPRLGGRRRVAELLGEVVLERVARFLLHMQLDVVASLERSADRVDLFVRDERVAAAEVKDRRARELAGVVEARG